MHIGSITCRADVHNRSIRYVMSILIFNKRFPSFDESKDGTGEGMTNSIISEPERVDLGVQDIRG